MELNRQGVMEDRLAVTTRANPDPLVKEAMAERMAVVLAVEVVIMAVAAEHGPVAQGGPLIQARRS
ncbi:hypothetical protein PHIN7_13380 [Polynucleobacter sp. HIN7]|nr:hypothetical protein PHIN7_13380 [Polynucleobacter sp. HIN7]